MMNLLALGLVLTSLATAGIFSPTPQNTIESKEDVIVKEGHRVVVVEYEKEDGNTKVLISPQDSSSSATVQNVDGKGFAGKVYDEMSGRVEGVKEGVKEASSSVADGIEKVGKQEEEVLHKFRPRELVCDAYGKCKHKIASAFEKTKDAASEAEEAAKEAAEKVKDTVAHTAHKASDRVREAKENVKETAHKASDKVQEAKENVKGKMFEKASGMKGEAEKKVEGAKDMVAEKAKEAEESARRAKKQGKKKLGGILQHAGVVAGDIFDYIAPPKRVAPVAGIMHLMGFAAAYGMSLWITFASSYVLAGALPKQQFAMVQSKIYPVYFKGMGCSVGMALLGYLVGPSRRSLPASVVAFQTLNLASSLAMILTNLMWLEPRATKVMLERMKKDKEEGTAKEAPATTTEPSRTVPGPGPAAETAGRGSTGEEVVARSEIVVLSQTLQRLNSYSSFVNAMALVSLTWHLVHLSQRLQATAC